MRLHCLFPGNAITPPTVSFEHQLLNSKATSANTTELFFGFPFDRAINTPYSMVWHIIRAGILRAA